MQPGDVPETYADVSALFEAVGFRPNTPIRDGIDSFVEWFCTFIRREQAAPN
jgi:UDP-glucuronate 4-epimerase